MLHGGHKIHDESSMGDMDIIPQGMVFESHLLTIDLWKSDGGGGIV